MLADVSAAPSAPLGASAAEQFAAATQRLRQALAEVADDARGDRSMRITVAARTGRLGRRGDAWIEIETPDGELFFLRFGPRGAQTRVVDRAPGQVSAARSPGDSAPGVARYHALASPEQLQRALGYARRQAETQREYRLLGYNTAAFAAQMFAEATEVRLSAGRVPGTRDLAAAITGQNKAGAGLRPDVPPTGPAPTGLARPDVMARYLEDVAALASKWDGLSRQERAKELVDAVNKRLLEIGVEEVRHDLGDLSEADAAKFLPGEVFTPGWSIILDSQKIAERSLDEVASSVYHEARHAEQTFLILRMAGAAGIAVRANTPSSLGACAMRRPAGRWWRARPSTEPPCAGSSRSITANRCTEELRGSRRRRSAPGRG